MEVLRFVESIAITLFQHRSQEIQRGEREGEILWGWALEELKLNRGFGPQLIGSLYRC